jgi:hypothetical protein
LAHKIAHQFPIRERNWLRILGNTAATNILLVFGDLHFTTLTGLLAAEGIQFDIFAERVGVDPANDPEYVAFRYAIENNLFGMSDCFCLKN